MDFDEKGDGPGKRSYPNRTQALREQLDHQNTTDRRTRIAELLEANREVHAPNAELADDNQRLQAPLTQAQDDLIAVRASLR